MVNKRKNLWKLVENTPAFTSSTTAIIAHTDVPVTLNLEVIDVTAGDTVTIAPIWQPDGATFAVTDATPSNPAHATMTWTPPGSGIYAACFSAQDSQGVVASGLHCITIDVVNETPETFTAAPATQVIKTTVSGFAIGMSTVRVVVADDYSIVDCSFSVG